MRYADRPMPPPQQVGRQADACGTLDAMQQHQQAGSSIEQAEMVVVTQANVQADILARQSGCKAYASVPCPNWPHGKLPWPRATTWPDVRSARHSMTQADQQGVQGSTACWVTQVAGSTLSDPICHPVKHNDNGQAVGSCGRRRDLPVSLSGRDHLPGSPGAAAQVPLLTAGCSLAASRMWASALRSSYMA